MKAQSLFLINEGVGRGRQSRERFKRNGDLTNVMLYWLPGGVLFAAMDQPSLWLKDLAASLSQV
jgi:hypothetical protein